MKRAIETLGLHLTLLLYKEGADDQAYDEILESLERAKERGQQQPLDSDEGGRKAAHISVVADLGGARKNG